MICPACQTEYIGMHSCAGAPSASNLTVLPGSLAYAAQPSMYPDAAERRRYALLQASAALAAHPNENGEFWLPEAAVRFTEELLAIIERREGEAR